MNKPRRSFDDVLAWPTLGTVVTAVLTGLHFAPSGFDVTDEGYYLASIADPHRYVASLSFFGEAFHPLYVLLRGSIAGLRALNIVCIVAAGVWLSWLVATRLLLPSASPPSSRLRVSTMAIAAGIGSAALSIVSLHGRWMATPSYNSLAFLGLLTVAAAVVLLLSRQNDRALGPWLLLGLGGWLTFLGKSSTAALLTPATLVMLLVARRAHVVGIVVAAATAAVLVLLFALVEYASPGAFVERIGLGLRLLSLQNAGYEFGTVLARLAVLPTGSRALTVYGLLIGMLAWAWWSGPRHARFVVPLILAGAIAGSLFFYRVGIGNAYAKEAFVQLLLVLAVLGTCFWLAAASHLRNVRDLGAPRCALSLYLCTLPLMYAFGTSNDYLSQANMAGLFWVLGGLVFVAPLLHSGTPRWVLPVTACFVAGSSLAVVFMAAESPYRQDAPLRAATERVELGAERAGVYLTPARAEFIRTVQAAARNAGFAPGQHTLDFTGTSPGLLHAYGSHGVGLAWMLGGLAGTSATVGEALRHVPCPELASAWVLAAPETRNALDPLLLHGFGANLATDFELGAQWLNPLERETQILYRPTRSTAAATAACLATRPGESRTPG